MAVIRRFWPVPVIIAMLVIGLASLRTEVAIHPGYDFTIFLAAGGSVLHGLSPYTYTNLHATGFLHARAHGLLFPYMPWVAFIFAPLSVLGAIPALIVWDIHLAVVIFGVTFAWARELSIGTPWLAGLMAGISAAAVHNYGLGQLAILCLAFVVAALLAARKGNLPLAGALAVFAGLLKPQDAIVVPALVLLLALQHRELRKTLLAEAATVLALLGLPLLAQPSLLSNWLSFELAFAKIPNPGEIAGISLTSIVGWFGQTDTPSLKLVLVAAVIVAAVAFAVLRATRGETWASRSSWIILAPLTVWLLLTPYANQEDIVLVIPMLLLLVAAARLPILNRALIVAVAIVVSSTQEILMPRVNMSYSIDVVILAVLVAEVATMWMPSFELGLRGLMSQMSATTATRISR
jgi:hypothetical protein